MMNAIRLYYYNSDSFKALCAEQGFVFTYSYSYKVNSRREACIEASSLEVMEG